MPETPRKQLLAWEKELLGLYLSDHPLAEIIDSGRISGNTLIVELAERTPGTKVKIVGMVAGIRRITTKTNRTMAIIDLEDLTGNIELVAFPDCYEQLADIWQEDAILEVTAKLERRNEQLQLVCETASAELTLRAARPTVHRAVHVHLRVTDDMWDDIRSMQDVVEILKRHEGEDELRLHVRAGDSDKVLRSRSLGVDWNDVLAAELKRQLGSDRVRFEETRLAS